MIKDLEERLRDIVIRKTQKELSRLNKLSEFEKVLDSKLDHNAYLTYAIPNYEGFVSKALEEAEREV